MPAILPKPESKEQLSYEIYAFYNCDNSATVPEFLYNAMKRMNVYACAAFSCSRVAGT